VPKFKYRGATVTNQKGILEGIKSRWIRGKDFYHSVHNICLPMSCHTLKDENIRNHNLICCFVRNLISHPVGETYIEDVENSVLRSIIFRPKKEELAWENCIKKSFVTYRCKNILKVINRRKIKWAGHVTCMKKMRNSYNILVGKSEGKRTLGRPWRK
jgi:hypothetical protein